MPKRLKFRRARTAYQRFGRRGENCAVRLLKSLGLEILTRNYKESGGEIDIVARDGEVLCFVEVKSRKPRQRTRPADAVRLAQKFRIVRTAGHYLNQIEQTRDPRIAWRYDIIEVIMTRWRLIEIRHWPDEFNGDDVRRLMTARHR